MSKTSKTDQSSKYFYILASVYVASMLTSLTVSARLFPFHIPETGLTILLTGGTWTIPLTFFVQDITTEVYGYIKSRKIIQISILILIFYIIYTKLITYLPIPTTPNIDNSYNQVFNTLPRHLIALLLAISIGNLANNYVLSKLKIKLKGKYLPIRFIFSSAIGEALLQIVGTSFAWIGNLSFSHEILPFVAFSYFYKLAFETAMTPINIIVCKKLKKAEGIDFYDYKISYISLS